MSEQAKDGVPAYSLLPLTAWAVALAVLTVPGATWVNVERVSYQDFSPAILVIAYAPMVAALIAASFQRGGIRKLLTQFLRWNVGAHWYAIAVLEPILLVLAATALFVAFGGSAPTNWLVVPPLAAVPAPIGPIIAGSLGEEPGWRGFAQPYLQRKLPALAAAAIVGILWSLWHLWPALTTQLSVADVAQTVVRLISTAVIYSWLYNATGGSLPLVMVAHAAHNIAIDLMPAQVVGTNLGAWNVTSLYAVAAMAVIVLTSARGQTCSSLSQTSTTRGCG